MPVWRGIVADQVSIVASDKQSDIDEVRRTESAIRESQRNVLKASNIANPKRHSGQPTMTVSDIFSPRWRSCNNGRGREIKLLDDGLFLVPPPTLRLRLMTTPFLLIDNRGI